MKRVLTFSTASCTGYLLAYEADDAAQSRIKDLVEKYNSEEAWKARNCDGNAVAYDSEAEALAAWKASRDVLRDAGYGSEPITTLAGLADWYAADGMANDSTTAEHAAEFLTLDPMGDEWADADCWWGRRS